jgi:hypothetical protein
MDTRDGLISAIDSFVGRLHPRYEVHRSEIGDGVQWRFCRDDIELGRVTVLQRAPGDWRPCFTYTAMALGADRAMKEQGHTRNLDVSPTDDLKIAPDEFQRDAEFKRLMNRLWGYMAPFLADREPDQQETEPSTLPAATAGSSGPAPTEPDETDELWWQEYVPQDRWQIVDLWRQGYTAPDISEYPDTALSPGRVRNIMCDLRKRISAEHGAELARRAVPTHSR